MLLAMGAQGGGGGSGAPIDATYIVQTPNGDLTNEQALSALATGLLKNTTVTGVLSIAAQGTDYYAPGGTDVAVADGGTGASTAANARTNLGLGTIATVNDAPSDGSTYGRNNGAWAAVVAGVTSVFSRTGAVISANGDYTASQVTNVPAGNIAGVTVQAAIDELDTEKAGLALSNLFTVRQDIRAAGSSFAAGAYIPWITGDTLSTLYVGSTSTSATVKAIEAYAANQVMYLESKHTSNSYNTLQILTNSTNGTCISAVSRATAAPGTAMYLESAGALTMYMENKGTATLNNKIEMFRIIRAPSSGTPLAGFGYHIGFFGNSSTSYGQAMARIGVAWNNGPAGTGHAHASRSADIIFENVHNAASIAETFRIKSSGYLDVIASLTTDTAPADDTTMKRLSLQKLAAPPTNAAYIQFTNSPGSDDFYLVLEEAVN